MHPKQEANARLREERARLAAEQKEATAVVILKHKLRFVHIRRSKNHPNYYARNGQDMAAKGGITVAYALPERRGDRMIAVTCAVCHDTDAYHKAAGRFVASLHFSMGSHIGVRVPKNGLPAFFLKNMFSSML